MRALARVMRAIGFCHLLLQSRAPVPRSLLVRSRLAPTESFGSAHAARPERVASRRTNDQAPSGFTPPWWLEGIADSFSNRRPSSCRARRAARPRRLCESLRFGPRVRTAPRSLRARPVKASPCRDLARLPSKGAFHRPSSCDACRAWRGTRPSPHEPARLSEVLPPPCRALRFFVSTMPRCFLQTRLSRLGPRTHLWIGLIEVLL